MFRNNSTTQEVVQDARKLADDIAQLTVQGGRKAQEVMHGASEEAAREWHEVERVAKEKAHQIDTYAHEKPWMAVGIAAVVGAVIGSLFLRRR